MKSKKFVSVVILTICLAVFASVMTLRTVAESEASIGKCWWEMNTAHNIADLMRALHWDQGTPGQKAALSEAGKQWTNSNNKRKELEAAATPTPEPSPKLQFLGNYQLTAYPAGTGPNSYNGKNQTLNYTAAADGIPGGTWLYIEGYGEYYVEDSGVGNTYTIDLYMGDPATCRQFGRKFNVPVYKILDR